jgi:hypothetical protein
MDRSADARGFLSSCQRRVWGSTADGRNVVDGVSLDRRMQADRLGEGPELY